MMAPRQIATRQPEPGLLDPGGHLDARKFQVDDRLDGGQQIAVAAGEDADVVHPLDGQPHEVDGERDVDALLLRRYLRPTARIPQGPLDDSHARIPQPRVGLAGIRSVRTRLAVGRRLTAIDAHAYQAAVGVSAADEQSGQTDGIEVGARRAGACSLEPAVGAEVEVLIVEEDHRPLAGRNKPTSPGERWEVMR